jgi:hypothetical protein
MARNPFEFMADAPLFVVPRMLERLRAYRDGPTPERTASLAPSWSA